MPGMPGVSSWGGRTNLNDTSIGIEIVNRAADNQGQFSFPPYQPRQIEAIEVLALDILKRYRHQPRQCGGAFRHCRRQEKRPGPDFQRLVRAFQLHFRPARHDGVMDSETAANLAALVKKYCP